MDGQRVFRKTDKGMEAITARLHGLVGRSRSLLILVDGKRSQDELHTLASGFGDVADMLDALVRDGFAEPVPPAHRCSAGRVSPATAQRRSSPHRTVRPCACGPAAVSLAQTKAFTCHRLIELLGPTADPLCLKIEATRNRTDFLPRCNAPMRWCAKCAARRRPTGSAPRSRPTCPLPERR